MTYQNGKCEYTGPRTKREGPTRTKDEIRYGKLWAEIELPKLLQEGDKQ